MRQISVNSTVTFAMASGVTKVIHRCEDAQESEILGRNYFLLDELNWIVCQKLRN